MDQPVEQPAVKDHRSDFMGKVSRSSFPSPRVFQLLGLICLCILFGLVGFRPAVADRNIPLFLSMTQEWEKVAGEQYIGDFPNPDTLLDHELYLLTDRQGHPLLFYSDILTPVCIEGVCKPVYVELYWDLTGVYAGFGLYPDRPLTKFDHEEFTEEDYRKIHRLLSDPNAVFRRRTLSELFDANATPHKRIEYQGVELDAVSGATIKEIKESVVEGALYSCYTLWHLAHGEASRKIESYLQAAYSDDLRQYFLDSNHEHYWFYALKQMDGTDFIRYAQRITDIFQMGRPLIRSYILKKFPKESLRQEEIARELFGAFSSVDINSKTLLIDNLSYAHPVALELLSAQVEMMSQNQLKSYLSFLKRDKARLTAVAAGNLRRGATSTEYAYSYLIAEFLNN